MTRMTKETYKVRGTTIQSVLDRLHLAPIPLGDPDGPVYVTRSDHFIYIEDKAARRVWQIDVARKVRSYKGMGRGDLWTGWEEAGA